MCKVYGQQLIDHKEIDMNWDKKQPKGCADIDTSYLSAKLGDTVSLGTDGVAYVVIDRDLKYMDSNGDPDRLYAMLSPKGKRAGSQNYIITHFALEKKMYRKPKEVFVTPGQLLEMGPCYDGLVAIAVTMLGAERNAFRGLPDAAVAFRVTQQAITSKKLSDAYKVADLKHLYEVNFKARVPDSYLQFIAHACKLMPLGTSANRETLKRLLGVE